MIDLNLKNNVQLDNALSDLQSIGNKKSYSKEDLEKISLTMIGMGPEEMILHQFIKDHKLLDTIQYIKEKVKIEATIPKYDIIVAPYLFSLQTTGVSQFVLEALSLGKPVIGSDIATISELVKHGVNGLLFKSGDARDLSKKISNLVDNNELRELMAANAKESVKNYRITEMADSFIKHIINKP